MCFELHGTGHCPYLSLCHCLMRETSSRIYSVLAQVVSVVSERGHQTSHVPGHSALSLTIVWTNEKS
jgi:hypothetical protein